MEPFNFQEVTFDDKQIQEADLDSFNNVIHYDSALIDLTTGKHTNSSQVSDSSTFACKFRCSIIEVYYNQATTKLAFHSNETSEDKLSII